MSACMPTDGKPSPTAEPATVQPNGGVPDATTFSATSQPAPATAAAADYALDATFLKQLLERAPDEPSPIAGGLRLGHIFELVQLFAPMRWRKAGLGCGKQPALRTWLQRLSPGAAGLVAEQLSGDALNLLCKRLERAQAAHAQAVADACRDARSKKESVVEAAAKKLAELQSRLAQPLDFCGAHAELAAPAPPRAAAKPRSLPSTPPSPPTPDAHAHTSGEVEPPSAAALQKVVAQQQRRLSQLQGEVQALGEERFATELLAIRERSARQEAAAALRAVQRELEATEAALATAQGEGARAAKVHAEALKRQRQAAAAQRSQDSGDWRNELLREQKLRSEAEQAQVAAERRMREAQAEARRARAAAAEEQQAREASMQEELALLSAALQRAETTVRSEQTARGIAVRRAEQAEAMLLRQEKEKTNESSTVRCAARREAAQKAELHAARETVAELRVQLQAAASQLPAQREVAWRQEGALVDRQQEASLAVTLVDPRKGQHFTPRTLEFLRRIVDETGMSFEAEAKANALYLQLYLGDNWQDKAGRLLHCNREAEHAFYALGMLDRDRAAEAGALDDSPVAVGADAGNKGRAMDMICLSLWDAKASKPYERPLACADLNGDQSAANAAAVVERALEQDGRRPGLTVQVLTDGATAALGEGEALITTQQAKAAAARRKGGGGLPPTDFVAAAVRESCCIHAKALQENGGLEAAFPGGMLEDALRLFWELFASNESTLRGVFGLVWVEVAQLPAVLFDKHLASLPEPTTSKWEVMYKTSFQMLPLLNAFNFHPVAEHRSTPMLALFLGKSREYLRGNVTADGTKVPAAVREKVYYLSGIVHEKQLLGGIPLVVDMWEQSYAGFYKFAKSPSEYGAFEAPHLRHMMAEQALQDTAFYQAALQDPKKALPRFTKFMEQSALPSQTKAEMASRGVAFLQAASDSHQKWNGSTWTQPHHLLGLLCLEPRRARFAAALLSQLGLDDELQEALAAASAAQPRAASRRTAAAQQPPPQDEVDRLAAARLAEHAADGSLGRLVSEQGLRQPAVVRELLLLASAPAGQTKVDPVLGRAQTPLLYSKFIPMLFVGFAHNLRLESLVSVLGKLERAHPKANAQLLDHMFYYRTSHAAEREARCAPEMRSAHGGGARQAALDLAAESKRLPGGTRAKLQQVLMLKQAEEQAVGYAKARLVRRGAESVKQRRRRRREQFDSVRRELTRLKFEHLRRTAAVTAAGNARRAALSGSECAMLIPKLAAANAKVKKGRGNIFKASNGVAERKALLKETLKAAAAARTRLARKRPLNRRELRAACDERPERREAAAAAAAARTATREQPARAKRKAAVVEVEEEEEEYEGEEDKAEEEDPGAAARCERAEQVRTLRKRRAMLRAQLNELRGGAPQPTDPEDKKKNRVLHKEYREVKERLELMDLGLE